MQTTKPSVVKHSAIEVIVPQPWRKIGRIFNLIGIASFFGYGWRIFFYPEPPSADLLFAAWVNLISVPIFLCYTLPVFLNKYPAWLVRLVGEKYLHNLIADCKKRLGENRTEKAHLLMPQGWFNDKKVFWIVFIVGGFVLGILVGLGWL